MKSSMGVRFARIIGAVLLISLTGCMRDWNGPDVPSHTGRYFLNSTVNRTEPPREDFGLVIVHVKDSTGKELAILNTKVGDAMQWHVGWSQYGDTIILWSSDIGNKAWVIENNTVSEVPMTPSLNEQADWMKGP